MEKEFPLFMLAEMFRNLSAIPWRRLEIQYGGGPQGLHIHEQVRFARKVCLCLSVCLSVGSKLIRCIGNQVQEALEGATAERSHSNRQRMSFYVNITS